MSTGQDSQTRQNCFGGANKCSLSKTGPAVQVFRPGIIYISFKELHPVVSGFPFGMFYEEKSICHIAEIVECLLLMLIVLMKYRCTSLYMLDVKM